MFLRVAFRSLQHSASMHHQVLGQHRSMKYIRVHTYIHTHIIYTHTCIYISLLYHLQLLLLYHYNHYNHYNCYNCNITIFLSSQKKNMKTEELMNVQFPPQIAFNKFSALLSLVSCFDLNCLNKEFPILIPITFILLKSKASLYRP